MTEKKKRMADEALIEWLLYESGQSVANIAKATEVSWTTVSDLKKKKTQVAKIYFNTAATLTEYALQLKKIEKEELG